MSEFAVRETLFVPSPPRPEVLIGAASPLWAYFTGAAVSGAAFWWMTRWAQPENLEALFGVAEASARGALDLVAAEPAAGDEPPLVPVAQLLSAAEEIPARLVLTLQAAQDASLAAAEAAVAASIEAADGLAGAGGEAAELAALAASNGAASDGAASDGAASDRAASDRAAATEEATGRSEATAEALIEPILPPEPVGGEAAPISPLAEAVPTPPRESRVRGKAASAPPEPPPAS